MAFATATPIAMIAPMNDWTFSVVPRDQQHQHDAREHRRNGGHHDERQPQRLEVRGQQQKDDDDGDDEAGARCSVNVSRIGAIWPRTATRGAARRRAGARDRRVHLVAARPRSSPATLAVQRDHALAVDAIVLADDRGVLDPGDVAEQRMRRADRRVTGTTRRSSSVVICGCGTSHLHLEGDAGPRIGPVVRRHEAARRRRRDERPADLIDRDAELAGQLRDSTST